MAARGKKRPHHALRKATVTSSSEITEKVDAWKDSSGIHHEAHMPASGIVPPLLLGYSPEISLSIRLIGEFRLVITIA
jgi:hypothetical protein